jgi:hypothetical protein
MSTHREILIQEYEYIVGGEITKALRQEVIDATIGATTPGYLTDAERNQAIGRLQGLLEALNLAEDTYARMIDED